MSETVVSELLNQVNELTSFIERGLHRIEMTEKKRKRFHVFPSRTDKHKNGELKRFENEQRNKRDELKQKQIDNIDYRDHFKIKKINKNKLYLEWNNYFILTDFDEKELSEWIQINDTNKISKFTNDEFIKYISSNNKSFKSIYLQNIFNYDPSLIIKTMQMFHRRKYQRNDQKNLKKLIKTESKWWYKQFNIDCIDYIEWIKKSTQYEISPLVLIKNFLKSKRLFLGYQASMEMTKKEENNNDNTKHHRIPKIHLKFYHEITQIPANNMKWKENEYLKQEQYKIYYKWISYAIFQHENKWLHFKNDQLRDTQYDGLWEFDALKNRNRNKDPLLIPNINHILNISMCDAICNLCIYEGTIRDNIRIYKDLTVREPSLLFEKIVFKKIKDVVNIYNINNINNSNHKKLEIYNEKKIRKSNNKKRRCIHSADLSTLVSPDLLLSDYININGIDIIWMDMKFFFLSPNDDIGIELVKKSVLKYVKAFGNGCIVSCGLNENFKKYIKQLLIDNQCQMHSVLFLDASKWMQCITHYEKNKNKYMLT